MQVIRLEGSTVPAAVPKEEDGSQARRKRSYFKLVKRQSLRNKDLVSVQCITQRSGNMFERAKSGFLGGLQFDRAGRPKSYSVAGPVESFTKLHKKQRNTKCKETVKSLKQPPGSELRANRNSFNLKVPQFSRVSSDRAFQQRGIAEELKRVCYKKRYLIGRTLAYMSKLDSPGQKFQWNLRDQFGQFFQTVSKGKQPKAVSSGSSKPCGRRFDFSKIDWGKVKHLVRDYVGSIQELGSRVSQEPKLEQDLQWFKGQLKELKFREVKFNPYRLLAK